MFEILLDTAQPILYNISEHERVVQRGQPAGRLRAKYPAGRLRAKYPAGGA